MNAKIKSGQAGSWQVNPKDGTTFHLRKSLYRKTQKTGII